MTVVVGRTPILKSEAAMVAAARSHDVVGDLAGVAKSVGKPLLEASVPVIAIQPRRG
jgi:hypothetical protein